MFSVRLENGWRLPDMRSVGVRAASVSGGVAVIATTDGRVVRWPGAGTAAGDDVLVSGGAAELVELEKKGSEFRIEKVFVDPTGEHALATATLGGVGFTYYLPAGCGGGRLVARELPSLRTLISSVAWNASEGGGPFLVGTAHGRVLEVSIEAKGRDTAVERVWELPEAYAQSIASLKIEQFAPAAMPSSSSSAAAPRFYAMAVTGGPSIRCFHFNGGPNIASTFSASASSSSRQALLFTEVRSEAKDTSTTVGALRPAGPSPASRLGRQSVIVPSSSSSSSPGAAALHPAGIPLSNLTPLPSAELQFFVTSPSAVTSPLFGLSTANVKDHTLRPGTALRPDVFALLTHRGLLTGRLNLTASASSASSQALSGTVTGASPDSATAVVAANQAVVSSLQLIPYPHVAALGSAAAEASSSNERRTSTVRGPSSTFSSADAGFSSSTSTLVPAELSSSTPLAEAPLSLAITDYHFLLLFKHRLVAVSRISSDVVQELAFPEDRYGALKALVQDGAYSSGTAVRGSGGGIGSGLWLVSERGLFSIRLGSEDKEAWRLLLKKGDFAGALQALEAARKTAASADAAAALTFMQGGAGSRPTFPSGVRMDEAAYRRCRDAILSSQAEYHLQKGEHEAAAEAFRKLSSSASFEEVCLRLIHAGALPALQSFVNAKLESLSVAASEEADEGGYDDENGYGGAAASSSTSAAKALKLQRTVLCTWLTEMFLSRLHQAGHEATSSLTPSAIDASASSNAQQVAYEALVTAFRCFLSENKHSLDKGATLALLAAHGREEEMLFFATQLHDYERVIQHYLQRQDYKKALLTLRKVPSFSPNFEDLWYSHSPLLMQHAPRATCDAWREAMERDNPVPGGHGADYEAAESSGDGSSSDGIPGLDAVRLIPAMVRYEQQRSLFLSNSGIGSSAPAANASAALDLLRWEDYASGIDVALAFCEWVAARGHKGSKEKAFHNFLLSLYAQQPLEDLLVDYISTSLEGVVPAAVGTYRLRGGSTAAGGLGGSLSFGTNGRGAFEDFPGSRASQDGLAIEEAVSAFKGGRGPPFDLQFAVRVCLSERKFRACVKLFCAMGLYGEAVETALAVAGQRIAAVDRKTAVAANGSRAIDFREATSLAKAAAESMPETTRQQGGNVLSAAAEKRLKKKIWLRITGWVVSHGGGARDALDILSESGGVLRVDDVLPLFPSASLIDEFKAGVSDSIANTQLAITGLREEMRGYQDAADRIRNDIRALRDRCAYVRPGQKCEAKGCHSPLLAAPFYIFPCGHAFHRECCLGEVLRHLTRTSRRALEATVTDLAKVQAAIEAFSNGAAGSAGMPGGAAGGLMNIASAGKKGVLGGLWQSGSGGPAAGGNNASWLSGLGGGSGSSQGALLSARLLPLLPSAGAGSSSLQSSSAAVATLAKAAASASGSELMGALLKRREGLQASLDKTVAKECLFCGDIMIYSVAEPLSLTTPSGAYDGGGGARENDEDDWDV